MTKNIYTNVPPRPSSSRFWKQCALAVKDVRDGFSMRQLWFHMAWGEVCGRYRRTVLGPFWATGSLAIFVGTLGILYSTLWNLDVDVYLPYLTAGFMTWLFVSSMIMEGCTVFSNSVNVVRQRKLPYTVFVLAMVARNLMASAHHLLVFVVVALLFSVKITLFSALVAVGGLILTTANIFWIVYILGPICSRFRDIPQLVTSLIQIAMFVTPIMWPVEYGKGRAEIIFVQLNPFYHLVEVIRAPLLGKIPDMSVYLYLIIMLIIGMALSFLSYAKTRERIIYWI